MTDDKKVQEMQMMEYNLQNILMQKQAFQMELAESQASLKELKNSGDEVFKIIGQLMVKTNKEEMEKELQEKEKIIKLRIDTLEKQEKTWTEKLQKLREEVLNKK